MYLWIFSLLCLCGEMIMICQIICVCLPVLFQNLHNMHRSVWLFCLHKESIQLKTYNLYPKYGGHGCKIIAFEQCSAHAGLCQRTQNRICLKTDDNPVIFKLLLSDTTFINHVQDYILMLLKPTFASPAVTKQVGLWDSKQPFVTKTDFKYFGTYAEKTF